MLKRIYWLPIIVLIMAGCGKTEDTTTYYGQNCNYTTSTVVAPAAEITYLQNYLSSRSITATKDSSGIFYKIDSVGSGTTAPTVCSGVTISYVGNLLTADNADPQFDAHTGVSFVLGDLILGWQRGLPLIRRGGSITLYIPPSLGYGSTAQGTVIPANSYLKFSIQLLGVQ